MAFTDQRHERDVGGRVGTGLFMGVLRLVQCGVQVPGIDTHGSHKLESSNTRLVCKADYQLSVGQQLYSDQR